MVAGVAAPAAAQVPGLTATLTVPSSTTVGVSVQATAVFTPPAGSTTPVQVGIRLIGAGHERNPRDGQQYERVDGLHSAAGKFHGGPLRLDTGRRRAADPHRDHQPSRCHLFAVAATSALPGSLQAASPAPAPPSPSRSRCRQRRPPRRSRRQPLRAPRRAPQSHRPVPPRPTQAQPCRRPAGRTPAHSSPWWFSLWAPSCSS